MNGRIEVRNVIPLSLIISVEPALVVIAAAPMTTQSDMRLELRPALGADDFAQIGRRDRRFVGDAKIEIAPGLGCPVEQNRAKRDVSRMSVGF